MRNEVQKVAFAEAPSQTPIGSPLMTGPDGRQVPLQGLAWLDAKNSRVLRIRLSLMGQPPQGALRAMTLDIRFVPVEFKSLERVYSLPATATLDLTYEGLEVLNVHRFFDFHLYGFDDQADPALKAQNSGVPGTPVAGRRCECTAGQVVSVKPRWQTDRCASVATAGERTGSGERPGSVSTWELHCAKPTTFHI
ncbi:MAG: hypothetical protein WBW33_21750 [Bryobacteraceae bacterium]